MDSCADVKNLCGVENPNPLKIVPAFDTATSKAWREYEPGELVIAAGIKHDDVRREDLVSACQVAITNPDCFDDWHLFHHVATVFNGRRASFEFLDAISYIEAAWACHVLKTLNPVHEFGLGVQRYIAALCLHDGVIFFPWIGGKGLNLCTFYPVKGLLEKSLCKIADDIQEKYASGVLSTLESSDVDDKDPLHVQLAKIVNAEEYIRRNVAC